MVLAASYLHDLDPFLIRFTDSFGLRWYGLAYAAGFLCTWLAFRWMSATGRSPLGRREIGDLMVYGMAGVLLGGRLGYAIFYDPALFIGFTSSLPFWDILAINKGGMASHGGIAGAILGCVVFGRRRSIRHAWRALRSGRRDRACPILARNAGARSALHILDIAALTCTFGLCFGRIANFINGELWGKALPDDRQTWLDPAAAPPWWSVKYPDEVTHWTAAATPGFDQRMEAIAPLQILLDPGPGFLDRVEHALRAGRPEVVEVVKPQLTAFYPSQLLQAISDGPVLLAILVIIWIRPRRPGVVGSWFMIAYGVLRIATEIFRQPDEGVAIVAGLQRGQLLSVVIILVGVIGVPIAARRPVAPLGGWRRR